MSRTAKISIHLGTKKTGKTFENLNIIRNYVNSKNRPVIILSPMQPEYEIFEKIDVEDLQNFKKLIVPKKIVRITDLDQVPRVCELLNKYVRNALIVFEDATRYIDANPAKPITSLIYNNRNIGLDLLFIFHGFKAIPNLLMSNVDILILRKTKDNFRTGTVKQKIEIYETDILAAVASVEKQNKALAKKHSKPTDPLNGINYASEILTF